MSWLNKFAEDLGKLAGKEIKVEENKLVFPPGFANGQFEFLELTEGLGLLKVNCIFNHDLMLTRASSDDNENLYWHFNISLERLNADEESSPINVDSDKFVLHSSSLLKQQLLFPAKRKIRLLTVVATRAWLLKLIHDYRIPQKGIVRNYIYNKPVSESYHFISNCYHHAQRILDSQVDPLIKEIFLTGEVLILLSDFFRYNGDAEQNDIFLIAADNIKRGVNKLNDREFPLPALSTLVRECGISLSVFTNVFEKLYGYDYDDYLNQLKMERAFHMIRHAKMQPGVASEITGYKTFNDFSTAFRNYFGISPNEIDK